jgi:maltose alpha-D-glucosyltransferase/alpha-amylase
VARPLREAHAHDTDPLWYKDAILYQLHVRAFHDSNADGIGDFRGLAEKLDYVRDLGVTTLWLQPFYPSPLKDDGYDIAGYTDVHPDYGTLADFKLFLREAKARGLRVVTELVVNHTSDQHPWFQRARRAKPGTPQRDFYVWSDTLERYKDARIIFKDFEVSNWTWDPLAQAYYWHRFYSHQPDLNYDNPAVIKAILKVMDFWLELGVDGMRLDAVPYLFEREGTSCENLPETHGALKKLRAHVDKHHHARMLLAEANQWPEDAAAYFGGGRGDECHMAFHFPLMPRMFMALRMEDRYPIIDILSQTPAVPETAQWAIFLRNHDELTLEMVTDEERDYMYRVYAEDARARINLGIRRRLAPLLGNDRRRIELLTSLLMSLPGTPVIYYGDEIGMGDNIYLGDRNGVRTPMQWSADRNAGFSRGNPQRLYLPPIIDPDFSYETVNAETQLNNPHSLLWWTRRIVALRKRVRAFGRGTLDFLHPSNGKVLAFVRRHEDETVLVVANLSRLVQHVELELREWKERVPVEMFGGTDFPRIGEAPYMLTLGPHGCYWFSLQARSAALHELAADATPAEIPTLAAQTSVEGLFRGRGRAGLEEIVPAFLRSRRWFGGKARRIKRAEIAEAVPVPLADSATAFLALVRVEYAEGDPDSYAVTFAHATGEEARRLLEQQAHRVLARVRIEGEDGVLYGAFADKAFGEALLDVVARRRVLRGLHGDLVGVPGRDFRRLRGTVALEPALLGAEQSNSSLRFGDRLILKLFRRVDQGPNPDVEIGRFLTERARFGHTPAVAGAIEYRPRKGQPSSLAIVQQCVPNQGDAWRFSLDAVGRYFERVLAMPVEERNPPPLPPGTLLERSRLEIPVEAQQPIGTYLSDARLLGQRTGELHLALASEPDDPAFAPEAFTPFYQRSLYQSMRNLTEKTFAVLKRRQGALPEAARAEAAALLARQGEVLKRFRLILDRKLTARRTRVHGDYHLGQVLRNDGGFVLIDFEGEPALPLSTRRIKRCPLRDAAGMVRSFHYAAHQGLLATLTRVAALPEERAHLEPWANHWFAWVAAAFLRGYLDTTARAAFLPNDERELEMLFTFYLLEKAVYELGYELNNRPEWVHLPLAGIRHLLEGSR